MVLVSGMIIGTFFTLFVLPAIYILISRETENDANGNIIEMENEHHAL